VFWPGELLAAGRMARREMPEQVRLAGLALLVAARWEALEQVRLLRAGRMARLEMPEQVRLAGLALLVAARWEALEQVRLLRLAESLPAVSISPWEMLEPMRLKALEAAATTILRFPLRFPGYPLFLTGFPMPSACRTIATTMPIISAHLAISSCALTTSAAA
jgi:hypothetical protein